MTAAHCLIVEDLPTTAAWLQQVVAQAYPHLQTHICANLQQARASLQAYAQADAPALQLLLLDLGLPDGYGGDLLPWVASHLPQTVAVVATIYDDDDHVFKALAAGARGYLLKDDSAEALVEYLKRIERGEPPLSPAIARRILQHFHLGAMPVPKPRPAPQVEFLPSEQGDCLDKFSPREAQTLQWIAQGLTVAECAQQMQLSPLTVAGYVKKIYQKLQISTRAEATREAIKRGMI
jgi:DNA-binding NarL/FixJ family response regulator